MRQLPLLQTRLDAPIELFSNFLTDEEADRLLARSLELPWKQSYNVFQGARTPMPRLEGMYGDSLDYQYRYGQIVLKAAPWPDFLKRLRDCVWGATGHAFHLVIGNLYRTHNDSIGYHADDDPSLGVMPAIASISLGAERDFLIRANTKGSPIEKIALPHGSLLLMKPGCQATHVHSLPKTTRECDVRVNWTFRPHL